MLDESPVDTFEGRKLSCWPGVKGSKLFLVNTKEEWDHVYPHLMSQDFLACDTETSGFDWYASHHICGMSFGWKDTHFYVPVRHIDSVLGGPVLPQINMDEILEDLKKLFGDPKRVTAWHNAKFDLHFYDREGVQVKCKIHDTMLLWSIFNENAPKALKDISAGWKDVFGRNVKGVVDATANTLEKKVRAWRGSEARARRTAYNNLVKDKCTELATQLEHQDKTLAKLKKYVTTEVLPDHPWKKASINDIGYDCVPISMMTEYAALDTYLTYKLYEHIVTKIQWTKGLQALYKNELALMDALFRAEKHGMRIDRAGLEKAGEGYLAESNELLERIQDIFPGVNIDSNQQLSVAFREVLGAKLIKTTEKSTPEEPVYSMDSEVLNDLATKYPVAELILQKRGADKLRATYVEGIKDKLTPDNVLHCTFNQNVSTGRMSSQDPNLQNIPGRDKTIRNAFVSWSDEYEYILADYSQIELRLTAHYSQDPLLLDAYAKGQDIHTRTFCEMFGVDIDEAVAVLADEHHPLHEEYSSFRTISKKINFGIIYGVTAPGLSRQIVRPRRYKALNQDQWVGKCQEFIDQYFTKHVGVKKFIKQSGRLVQHQGYVTNYFGRVRRLPGSQATKVLGDEYYWMEKRAKRQGTNFLIQGSAADLFKVAVVRVDRILQDTKSHIGNLVHDEIQWYQHKSEMHLLPKIKQAMENWNFTVPIIAEVSQANPTWGKKTKLDIHY